MNELRRVGDPTLLVVAGVYGGALLVARGAGLLGLPLAVLVLFSMSRYGYEVLRIAAQGRARLLPAPGIETMSPVGELPLALHFVFFTSLAWLLSDPPVAPGSPLAFAARAALLLVVVAFPASAALMALTQSLLAALDPRGIAALIREVGPRRYMLVPALAACGGLAVVLIGRTGGLGALLAMPLAVFGLFAMFFATGLTVRSARDAIDIPGEKPSDEDYAERLLHRDWQNQLDIAYASIRSGLVEQGYRTIRALIEGDGFSDAVHRWVLARMLEWEDRAHGRAFGASYVERLLAADRSHAALELAAQLRDDTGRITLPGSAAKRLADYAESIGRYRLADELRAD